MQTKPCLKCKITKELSEFYYRKSNNRYHSECKECTKLQVSLYINSNKANILKQKRVYYNTNKTHIKLIQSEYRISNKNKRAEYDKEYRINNPEKIREKDRKRRAQKRKVNENYKSKDEKYTRELFQHKCANCGSTDNLCIDHHKPLSKGNPLTRQNAVLLCKTCNGSKWIKSPEDFYTNEKLIEINTLLQIIS